MRLTGRRAPASLLIAQRRLVASRWLPVSGSDNCSTRKPAKLTTYRPCVVTTVCQRATLHRYSGRLSILPSYAPLVCPSVHTSMKFYFLWSVLERFSAFGRSQADVTVICIYYRIICVRSVHSTCLPIPKTFFF